MSRNTNFLDSPLLSNILDSDSYKFSQPVQYPDCMTNMFSYFESRGGKYPKTLFFGLQYYINRFLSNPITVDDVIEAERFAKAHGVPFPRDGWMRIAEKHSGFLPLKIMAVPEGSVVPVGNILFSIESTDREIPWIVSWMETMFVRMWYPITVATVSYYIKKEIKTYLEETCDNPESELLFKLHDFGSRGVSSQESAAIGGAAHLVNFRGSDTVAGVYLANKYYGCDMSGFSIPASEHSTMSMYGRDNEVGAYRNMIDQFGSGPIFACVSDTWDIYNAAENIWGGELKEEVKKMNATLVVRPDSGDPIEVVVDTVKTLARKFGTKTNSKGYKVLNKVRVIQGDGIEPEDITYILSALKSEKFSAENVAFGMGGGLLQKINRDTQKFAFKCSSAVINGERRDVFKEPVTDRVKKSKRGVLDLRIQRDNQVLTTAHNDGGPSVMQVVYYDSVKHNETTMDEIRERSQTEFDQFRGWTDRGL